MKLIGDYHTHTIYSHGKSTVEENVLEAIDQGLKTIAISEHGPGHIFYGVKYDKLKEISNEIKRLREIHGHKIEILMGIEANVMDFDGNLDIGPREMELFDFIACGYHNGIMPKGLKSKVIYTPIRYGINLFSSDYIREIATDSLIKASYKYDLKFITHPGAKFPVNEVRLAREMNKSTLLEINNKHRNLDGEQIKKILDSDINFIVNSDAHSRKAVGRVENSFKAIQDSNLPLDRIYNVEKI